MKYAHSNLLFNKIVYNLHFISNKNINNTSVQFSVANNFAIEQSATKFGISTSSALAACLTIRRDATTFVAISANWNWRYYNKKKEAIKLFKYA